MGKLNVKNGTPLGCEHLCKRCTWGQIVSGYRESDLLVICTNAFPNTTVPFPVFDCSKFSDSQKPNLEQMKKLAIHLRPVRVSTRTRGFEPVTRIQPARADQDEGEATRTG